MEMKDYLTNYYERYDENARLISKHGMVEYITTMKYTVQTVSEISSGSLRKTGYGWLFSSHT